MIVSLHGIRTRGTWQKELSPAISEEGWIYYPLDYGWFSLFFFIPSWFRAKKIEWFRKRYNEIRLRYPDVIPSIIAHSFGTWILCHAMRKYQNIKFDKIILCGCIVKSKFPWKMLHERDQFTTIKNDCGQKDCWAQFSGLFAWGTGNGGWKGFEVTESFMKNDFYSEFSHSSFFGLDHYQGEWIPFLNKHVAFSSGEFPWTHEEPVSPYDAARWSAITYYHQFIKRIARAFQNNQIVQKGSRLPITFSGRMTIIVPKTPGEASQIFLPVFFSRQGFQPIEIGPEGDRRTAHMNEEGTIFDIPSTINSLVQLDHRTDLELTDAVLEFRRTLERLIESPESDVKRIVNIVSLEEFERGY